jgi:hypothetical protein
LLSDDIAVTIGGMSVYTGTRPSSFFNWNEEGEWMARLMFDIQCIGKFKEMEARSNGK